MRRYENTNIRRYEHTNIRICEERNIERADRRQREEIEERRGLQEREGTESSRDGGIFVATGASKAPIFQPSFALEDGEIDGEGKCSNMNRRKDEDTTSTGIGTETERTKKIVYASLPSSSSSSSFASSSTYPCFLVRPENGRVTWYTDSDGASLLSEEIQHIARQNALDIQYTDTGAETSDNEGHIEDENEELDSKL